MKNFAKITMGLICEIVLAISYFTVGFLTANFNESLPNMIFIIIYSILKLLLAVFYHHNKYFKLLSIDLFLNAIIAVPYFVGIIDIIFNGTGVLTNIIQCAVHDENGILFYILMNIVSILNLVLEIKLIKKRWTKNDSLYHKIIKNDDIV